MNDFNLKKTSKRKSFIGLNTFASLAILQFFLYCASTKAEILFSDLSHKKFPERAIARESVQRIKRGSNQKDFITFIELERENAFRSVMDCNKLKTRRFSLNGNTLIDIHDKFIDNNRNLSHIIVASEFCPMRHNLAMSRIVYTSMRSQIIKDRLLLDGKYFANCPSHDVVSLACANHAPQDKDGQPSFRTLP